MSRRLRQCGVSRVREPDEAIDIRNYGCDEQQPIPSGLNLSLQRSHDGGLPICRLRGIASCSQGTPVTDTASIAHLR